MEVIINKCDGLDGFLASRNMSIHDRKHGVMLIRTNPLNKDADDDIATVVATLVMLNPELRVSALSVIPASDGVAGAIVVFEPKA